MRRVCTVAFMDLAQLVIRALARDPLETVATSFEAAYRRVVLKREISIEQDDEA